MDILTGVFIECWNILAESAPYILFGFFAAGVLKAFLPEEAVARHLGRKSLGSAIKASLLGIPLPLCSCGVIPAAVGLRKQGARQSACSRNGIAGALCQGYLSPGGRQLSARDGFMRPLAESTSYPGHPTENFIKSDTRLLRRFRILSPR